MPTLSQKSIADIETKIKDVADEAGKRCGQSDVYYSSLLSEGVEQLLGSITDIQLREETITIARRYGYVPQDEVNDGPDDGDNEVCRHGLDYWTCPGGCFE